MRQSEQSRKLD